MNKVFLIGNLTRDPELSTTSSGVAYCRFSLAVSRRFAAADGNRETDFFNIVVWRGLAENCAKYLKKGSKAAISGSIQIRSYETPDGVKKYNTDIVADDVEFLTSKSDMSDIPAQPVEKSEKRASISQLQAVEEDLPF
ncbi:MAG: single-stranded DNA-binding protein [Christensenellales bacterium]